MSGWVEATVGISAVALWAVLGMDIVWAAILVFGVLVLIGLRWGPPSSFSHLVVALARSLWPPPEPPPRAVVSP